MKGLCAFPRSLLLNAFVNNQSFYLFSLSFCRIHLKVLEALIPLATVNKPMLVLATTAQIINDLHAKLIASSKPAASASVEAILCSVGSLALNHCQLCCREGLAEVQLDLFGGKERFVHVYNSLIKCILK